MITEILLLIQPPTNCKVINTRSDFLSGALITELLRCHCKQDLHLRPPDPIRSNSGQRHFQFYRSKVDRMCVVFLRRKVLSLHLI